MKESHIQTKIVNHLSQLARKHNFFFFSVPNESFMLAASNKGTVAKRSMYALLSILKKMGLTPGVPDLCIVHQGKAYFLEVKTEQGRLSVIQKAVIERLIECGASVNVVRSLRDAEKALVDWGIVK